MICPKCNTKIHGANKRKVCGVWLHQCSEKKRYPKKKRPQLQVGPALIYKEYNPVTNWKHGKSIQAINSSQRYSDGMLS